PTEKRAVEEPAIPAASDPAARAVVDRALDAQTGGQRQRLEKVKTHIVHLTGSLYSPQGEAEAALSIQAVWPGKRLTEWTTIHRGNRTIQTFWLLDGLGWMKGPDPENDGRLWLRPMSPSDMEAVLPEL